MSQTRRLAAILAADVAGYSRLIGADESGTLQRLRAIRDELVDPTIAAYHGRLVKTTGDGLLSCASWTQGTARTRGVGAGKTHGAVAVADYEHEVDHTAARSMY